MRETKDIRRIGVEWLDPFPKCWDAKRLKFCVELINEKNEPHGTNNNYIGLENVESYTGRMIVSAEDVVVEGTPNRFASGDVLFGKLRPYLAKVLHTNHAGVCTSELLVLRPKLVDSRFLFYYVLSQDFINVVDSSTYGAKMPRASWDFIGNLSQLIPPIPTQQAIAAFLDRKTERIDELIAKKQRLIELLQEKREALISQAVTKGLDPKVEMEDSGIQWLGKIPSHWCIGKFGRAAFFQEGPGLRNWQFTDAGIRVICVTNITENGIDFSNYQKFISEIEYRSSYTHFTVGRGDLLLSSSGNSWGKVAEFHDDQIAILNTSTIRVNSNRQNSVSRSLLKWMLQSDGTRKQLGLMMTGSCQPNFGPTHLSQLFVAVPPSSEQGLIASFLDRETMHLDRLRSKAEAQIIKLREYRQTLISAAVTGKIDVSKEVA